MKTSQTKKLISNLKKEIEELKKEIEEDKDPPQTPRLITRFEFYTAQLQFAEKLIEAIKKDVEKFKWKKNKTIKQKQIANTYAKQLGADWFADRHNQDLDKLIKILEAIGK